MSDETMYIMSPIDGSAEAERAFKKAVEIARASHSPLLIVYVKDDRGRDEAAHPGDSQMKQLLESYAAYAEKNGITTVETQYVTGAPKQQIAKVIPDTFPVRSIVIGATGRNAFERLMLGSVTEYVVRTAPCDVLVVRPTS